MHGYSHGAASYDEAMLKNLSTKEIEVLLSSMENDKSFMWHFTSNSTLNRLIMDLKIIREKSNILPKHLTQIDKYLGMIEKEVRKYFVANADEDE